MWDSSPVRTLCIVGFGKQIVYWHCVVRGFHKTFTYFSLDPFAPTLNQIPQKMKIYLYKWGKITSILHYRRLPPQKLELLVGSHYSFWESRGYVRKSLRRNLPAKHQWNGPKQLNSWDMKIILTELSRVRGAPWRGKFGWNFGPDKVVRKYVHPVM